MVFSSITIIKTEYARKYMQQMCKHFAHKVSVTYDEAKGHVDFPMGHSDMLVHSDHLQIDVTTEESAEARRTVETIIEKHLVKFAWREEISFEWQQR